MIWFVSDHHFNHANIIQYCERPFRDVREMEETLVANHNYRVRPEDTVWFLGDFVLGPLAEGRRILSRLNGRTKYLVLGNHDCLKGRFGETRMDFLEAGFLHTHTDNFAMPLPGRPGRGIVLSHYPMRTDKLVGSGMVNVHGHVHQNSVQEPLHINVSVDVTGFAPVSLDEIVERIDRMEV